MSLKSTKVYVSSSDSFGSPISHPDLVHGTRSDGNLGPLRSTGLLALPQGSKAFCRRHQSVWLSLMDLQCFSYIILAFIYIYIHVYIHIRFRLLDYCHVLWWENTGHDGVNGNVSHWGPKSCLSKRECYYSHDLYSVDYIQNTNTNKMQ